MRVENFFSLEGKTVFISGAAGYLGREMAQTLGQAGASLILNGRNAARLVEFAEELRSLNIQAQCAPFDMTDFASVRDYMGGLTRLDVLINNAVTMTPKSFAEAKPEDFDLTYRSAVTAAFEAARAARPALIRAVEAGGDASIVNIATMYAGLSPDPRIYNEPGQMSPPFYGAAKAGLVQLTRHLAAELGPYGVRANALAPGPFPKPSTSRHDPQFAGRLAARTMLGRTGQAQEIAGPVLFLASHASSFVTGTVLVADGGWSAW